ncbi:MAG: hypothetical protein SFV81_06940, partial [Pirellulaceae bacterium]|nr:hypothetical protein [Pirellulaceae bacterium]
MSNAVSLESLDGFRYLIRYLIESRQSKCLGRIRQNATHQIPATLSAAEVQFQMMTSHRFCAGNNLLWGA